jgi:hypothetical protein
VRKGLGLTGVCLLDLGQIGRLGGGTGWPAARRTAAGSSESTEIGSPGLGSAREKVGKRARMTGNSSRGLGRRDSMPEGAHGGEAAWPNFDERLDA